MNIKNSKSFSSFLNNNLIFFLLAFLGICVPVMHLFGSGSITLFLKYERLVSIQIVMNMIAVGLITLTSKHKMTP